MTILVPIDFSPITDRVCEVAAEAARARGAKVLLLHVALPDPDFVGFEAGPDVVRDQVAAEFRHEHRLLERLAKRLQSEQVEAASRLVQGPTVQTILDQAEANQVDLIVMATHGHGVMYQMLVGSVSEGVLRKTTRPILMVPAREIGV